MGLSSFTNIPDPKRYRRYTAWQIDPAGRPIRQILLHQDEPHDQEDTPEDLVLVAIPQHLHSPYWDRAANKWKEGNMGHRVWSITRWLTLPFLLTLLWVAQSQAAAIPQFQFPKPFVYGYPIYTYLAQQGVGSGGLGGLPGGGGTTSPLTTKGDLYTYSTVDARLAIGADALCLVADSAEATGIKWAACGSGSAHDLLSVTHGDTLGAAVTRGSIIIGNVTPAWSELVIGAANTFLGSDGTDAAWTGLTLAGAQFVNQGTTTTVLHGNAAGNPSFGAIDLTADVTGVLPDANVANNITIDLAAAATALAADPTNCAASSAAGGITAAGTAEACIAPLLLTGGTMTGAANFVAGTTSIPSFNIATGVAKTTPAAGDFWINGNRLHVYLNSVDETVAHVSELFAAATDDTILVDSGAAFQAKLLAGGALAYTLATNAFSQASAANLSNGTTGSGAVVLATSGTLVTPALGTPSALVLTNATGLVTAGIVDGDILPIDLDDAADVQADEECLTYEATGAIFEWQACGTGTPGGANTQVQFNSSGSFGASANMTWVSPKFTLGAAASATGQLGLAGTTSGVVTVQSAAAAGTWTMTLPTSAGASTNVLQTDGTGITSWVAAGGGETALTDVAYWPHGPPSYSPAGVLVNTDSVAFHGHVTAFTLMYPITVDAINFDVHTAATSNCDPTASSPCGLMFAVYDVADLTTQVCESEVGYGAHGTSTKDINSTGIKSLTMACTITPGTYLLSISSSSTTLQLGAMDGSTGGWSGIYNVNLSPRHHYITTAISTGAGASFDHDTDISADTFVAITNLGPATVMFEGD